MTTDTLFSAEDLAICACWCDSSDPFAVGAMGLRYCAGNADECHDFVAARALMAMADVVGRAPDADAPDDELARLDAAVVACGGDLDFVGGYRDSGRLLIEGRSGADYVPANWTPAWVAEWLAQDAEDADAEDACAALERSIERSMEARW